MHDNCQRTVKAVDHSLDTHDGCQGVIGKDKSDNAVFLHELQVDINIYKGIFTEMIAMTKYCKAIPFTGVVSPNRGKHFAPSFAL